MADQDFNITIKTVADTTGIKLTEQGLNEIKIAAFQGNKEAITALQQLTAAAAGSKQGLADIGQLGRIVGQFTGFGLGAAVYQLISGLKQASAEIEKVSAELDKQGQTLTDHAQRYSEEARHAKDQGDVLKLSDKTLKDIETTQKTLNDLTGKDLSNWAKLSDFAQKYLGNAQQGVYEEARRLEIETAFDQLMQARKQGMKEVLEAEQRSKETLEDHINILVREILEQDKLKASAKANNDPGGYVQAANNAARLRIELEKVIKLQEDRDKASAKAADKAGADQMSFAKNAITSSSAQTQAVLRNEEAARKAREAGDEKSADQYQKTADQLKKSMTQAQREEYEGLTKTAPIGRKAGVGESQEVVDQLELNKLNFERQQRGEPTKTLAQERADRATSIADLIRYMQGIWGY